MKKKKRSLPSQTQLSQLVILISLACFTSAARPRPGFLYTRNRGKCTPEFWSSTREAWPKMVPQFATVSNVFGSRAFERYRYDLTLAEAAAKNDDGENNAFARLVKQSTAALLNSYARRENNNFPYSPWEVKTLLIQALVSERAAILQAQQFSRANEACS